MDARVLSCKQAHSRAPHLHLMRCGPQPVLSLGETVETGLVK